MNRILRGRIERFCSHYHGPLFHALLCDPPYHLTSITARFGKAGSAPAKYGKDGAFARASAGFMGQKWDGGDVAFDPDTWAAMATLLYPGAFGMAFASSRGSHRLACAIEDAGFIIHPQIGWCYGSGFPKATRIDTAIDRANGLSRPDKLVGGHIGMGKHSGDDSNKNELGASIPHSINKSSLTNGTPIHPLAQVWQGHRYGLQAMKPALEPIIVFQKPYEGRPVDNITATGAGALWVDGGRVDHPGAHGTRGRNKFNGFAAGNGIGMLGGEIDSRKSPENPAGRWPSNLILQHNPDCHRVDGEWICSEGCAVRMVGEQSGVRTSGGSAGNRNHDYENQNCYGKFAPINYPKETSLPPDSGTAARFFFQSDWSYEIAERLAMAEPVRYEAKASRAERDAGLGGLEVRLITEADKWAVKDRRSGTARQPGEWEHAPVRNPHPTIKPIALTKYLASLLLPPAAYAPRRILVPFAGVASEMIGAVLAGWDEVIGVEMTAEYLPVARARLAWWADFVRWGQTDVDKILGATEAALPLFGEAA